MASIWDELERKARGAVTLVKAASAAGDAAFEKERRKYAEAAWRLEHPGQEPPKGPVLQAPRESPMRRWLRKGAIAAADALTTPGSASNQQFAEGFETIGELVSPMDVDTSMPNIDFGSKAVVPLAVKLNRRRAIQKTAEALAPGKVIERAASTTKGKEHVKFLKDVHFEDLAFPKYETPGAAAPIDRKVSSRDSYFHATRFSLVPDIVASGQIGHPELVGKKPKKTRKTLEYFSATDAQKVWEKLGEPNMTFVPFTHSHSYQKFVDTAKELGYVVKKDYPTDAHYNFWKPAGVEPTTSGVSLGRVNKIKSTIPRDVIFELDRGVMKRAGVPTRPYVESGFEKMEKSYNFDDDDYDKVYDINQNPKGFMEELKQKLIDKGHIGPGGSNDPDVTPSQIYLNKFKDFFEGDIAEFNYHENAQAFKKMIQENPSIGSSLGIKSTGSAEDGYTLYLKVPPKKKVSAPPSHPAAGFEYEERTWEQGVPLKGTVRRAFVNLDEVKNRGFSEEELRRNIEPLFSLTDDVRGYRTPGHGSTELHRILPSHVLSEGSRYALPRAKNFDDFKDILSGTLSTFKQSKDPVSGRKILEKSKPVGVPKSYEPPKGDAPSKLMAGVTPPVPPWKNPGSGLSEHITEHSFGFTDKQSNYWWNQDIYNLYAKDPDAFIEHVLDQPGYTKNDAKYMQQKLWKLYGPKDNLDAGMKEHLELADVQEYDLGPWDNFDPSDAEFDEVDDVKPLHLGQEEQVVGPDWYTMKEPKNPAGVAKSDNPFNLEVDFKNGDITDLDDGMVFGYDEYLAWKDEPKEFMKDLVVNVGFEPEAAKFIQENLWKMHTPATPLEKLGMKIKDIWKGKGK